MDGISIADDGFEVLGGGVSLGPRRHLDAEAVKALEEFSSRYGQLLQNPAGLLALGRDLYRWLDWDGGQLAALLQRGARPLRFEIVTAQRYPSQAEWALLNAPWELLADDQGFLAGDVPLGFGPFRRVGRADPPPPLDLHRLGLVFMAASPRGSVELDYEAEERAIIEAVGATKLDLLVEESGNPKELGERLGEYTGMQVLHVSCHGHNAWRDHPGADPKPILMLEDREGGELPTDADVLIRELRPHAPRLVFLSACLTSVAGPPRGEELGDKAARPG